MNRFYTPHSALAVAFRVPGRACFNVKGRQLLGSAELLWGSVCTGSREEMGQEEVASACAYLGNSFSERKGEKKKKKLGLFWR